MATEVLRPNGVGVETAISFQFPNEGAHWDKVDEDPPDDDTAYVHHGGGIYKRDLYALPASVGAGIISQIEVFIRWRTIQIAYDVGAKASIHTHATTYDGTERLTKSDTYIDFSEIWTTNPNTGSAWTWAEIDALEAGVNLWGGPAAEYVRCTQVYVIITYTPVVTGSATLSGTGTLAGIGALTLTALASLTGSGLLSARAVRIYTSKATLSGVGSLTARGVLTKEISALLTGTGSLSARAVLLLSSSATLSGAGTLTAVSRTIVAGVVTLSGVGTLATLTLLIKPPLRIYRIFYVEKFTGTQSYNRPFWSHSVGETFLSNLWREPVPFNLSSEYGLAIAHHGDYCWLSSPNGVWRAKLTAQSIDLTADVLSLRQELTETRGNLVVELRNDEGQYDSIGEGSLAVLDLSCQLDLSPGYLTASGNEFSPGQAFVLDAYEHISSGGKASLMLYASDGWHLIEAWRARHQFRWNKDQNELSVKQILEFVLARVGLKLEVISQSSLITSYYPDFTINPNNRGETIVRKLLSFVPDVLFIEGNKAYMVNPLATASSTYSYGSSHPIFEGRYRVGAWGLNRVQVEGYDSGADAPVIVDSFSWDEIDKLYDRLSQLYDRNIDSVAKAEERGEAYLREAEIESANGVIRIPVNCGQQLCDVIDITDTRAGLSAERKRVLGLTLVYNPNRGQYEHRLALGAV